MAVCKHEILRPITREDEVEYVECTQCGEIFDEDEIKEMDAGDIPRSDAA